MHNATTQHPVISSTTIFLKDYQPPVFEIESIYLTIELYDEEALVENKMIIKRRAPGELYLFGDALELIKLAMFDNNKVEINPCHYRFNGSDVIIDDCPDEFSLLIVTKIYPQNNTKLSGLFRSNKLFCTQCEAQGFRRITFFPDRPDVLTTFTTKISADKTKYPVLLSNGNLMDHGENPDGRHWVIWQDPFKKPSYLFALVAGDLICVNDEFITRSNKRIELKIYVEPGNEDKCSHAMSSLKKAMRWDEKVYGREYDLSIFMIVAVNDFNMGAMENKGLNIFNSKYVLARADTATDQDFADIEGVVAHEYFHNWTGNRVTCRDWFQLSLKEGLTVFRDQEFSRDMNSRDVNRILDVKLLRATQFPEDASSLAHPVRPESYQEINNFYTSTIYNKGAELIRMQHTLLGDKGFRQGMDLYFERHDGQAVTIDNFISAMQDANNKDLTQFSLWYCQAGTPKVTVQSTYHAKTLTLTMTQTCLPTPECQEKKPFHIPIRIALFDQSGSQLPLENEVLELQEKQQTFVISNIATKPILSLLRDFSAPITLNQELNLEEQLLLLRCETDGYIKWNIAQDLARTCVISFFKKSPSDCIIPSEFITAFHYVLLDKTLDEALRAELLTPPGFEEVITNLSLVDVSVIEQARDAYRLQLGQALFPQLLSTYQALWAEESNDRNAISCNKRKLRNVCLWLMMKANETSAIEFCLQQFAHRGTMTDQMASFILLNNCSRTEQRQQAIDKFYLDWANNELVLDKWFAAQASSELSDVLPRVKSLLKHKAFSLKNPNKVRSLIGVFSQANPRHFHAPDGSGYAFLGNMIAQLDAINPQIAAKLASPFTRWHRFDVTRQTMMKEELARLAAMQNVSRDLKEVVSKSLQNHE